MLDLGKKAKGVDGAPAYVVAKSDDGSGGYVDSEGEFDGSETLLCEVWAGSDRAVAAELPVVWYNLQEGETTQPPPPDYTRVMVTFPAATLDELEPGRYVGWITADAKTKHLADFCFELTPGPGTAVARVVYHTYKQLKDECPAIDRLVMNGADETQFNDIAAEAREWIDGRILEKAKTCGSCAYAYGYSYGYDDAWWSTSSPYAVALAADGLLLTTTGGLRISNASVFKTLAILMRRALWVTTAPEGMREMAEEYEDRAMRSLRSATADFAAEHSLASVKLGGGRLKR